jgi:excisionase family DNA binding protein
MTLAELVEEKTEALRVRDVARILDVSVKQIYKMAANGQIPSLRIANTVRFDPQEFAFWLRTKSSMGVTSPISSPPTTRPSTRHPRRQATPASKSRALGISRGSYNENLTEF